MSNRAAVANGNTSVPFYTIENLPVPTTPSNKILVKAVAYATNPTDWKHLVGKIAPVGAVVGSDFSGVVEEVGADVRGFAKGDYVSSWLHGGYEKDVGAFQDYVVADPVLTIKLDKSTIKTDALPVGDSPSGPIDTFEGAASLALGLSTVASSFSNQLAIKQNNPANKESYILIWGGATATGVLAIQVAKLVYGLNVIAAASAKHTDFLKGLGADAVVDYNDKDAIAQIKKIGAGKIHYGFDTVSNEQTWQSVYDATADTTEGTLHLDNLLFLGEANLKTDASRKNIKYGTTLAYIVTGESTNLGGGDIVPPAGLTENYNEFWFNILPQHLPKLKHSKLKVLKAGLASADEAFTLLFENKVSGEKVVFRAD